MRLRLLAAVLFGIATASAVTGAPALAQVQDQAKSKAEPQVPPAPAPQAPSPAAEAQPAPETLPAASAGSPGAAPEATAAPAPSDQPTPGASAAPTDPVAPIIEAKLADAATTKDAQPEDVAALSSFYEARQGKALWITEMGFSAKGQQALFEIEKAGDWGLDATAFALPAADVLPATPEAEALAEIKLDLAILKYARFARGGRLTPSKVSDLFDQAPPLRDPKLVLTEIATADAPDAYLRSLHPKHEQFARLREALLKARSADSDGAKPGANDKDIKRILINMERWRWMPEDLGSIYVLNNSAAFMLYVVKDDKTIYADKTLVGTIGYPTPVFSAPMTSIIFNPEWNAPETVVKENILPPLQKGSFSILRIHKLYVSYNGQPVDATKVDWNRVDGLAYTFSQKPGPENNLGKIKFSFPNPHTVYMHDTLPVRKKYFKQPVRMIGHECVRMERPEQFANVLLAESNGWTQDRVKELWDKSDTASVPLERAIPVHMVYFTAIGGENGKVETFADVYGLDRKMAVAMFGDATGFPEPPPESKQPPPGESDASGPAAQRTTADYGLARAMQGFVGD
jgi:L,D-transpeptidase YcbB